MENKAQDLEQNAQDLPLHQLQWIQSVEQYILEHISDPQLTIPELAKSFSLSTTPNLFIRKLKMNRAKQLLEAGKYTTVVETAHAVGYNQADYFSRLYQQWHGNRPIDYLKNKST